MCLVRQSRSRLLTFPPRLRVLFYCGYPYFGVRVCAPPCLALSYSLSLSLLLSYSLTLLLSYSLTLLLSYSLTLLLSYSLTPLLTLTLTLSLSLSLTRSLSLSLLLSLTVSLLLSLSLSLTLSPSLPLSLSPLPRHGSVSTKWHLTSARTSVTGKLQKERPTKQSSAFSSHMHTPKVRKTNHPRHILFSTFKTTIPAEIITVTNRK